MTAGPIAETPTAPRPQSTHALGQRRARIERKTGLTPRPKTRQLDPDTAWMDRARCATAPDTDRLAFVADGLSQDDAWPLVEVNCARCPVAAACLADARRSHLTGLAGGFVLADGHLAPDAPGDAAYRSASLIGSLRGTATTRSAPRDRLRAAALDDRARPGDHQVAARGRPRGAGQVAGPRPRPR